MARAGDGATAIAYSPVVLAGATVGARDLTPTPTEQHEIQLRRLVGLAGDLTTVRGVDSSSTSTTSALGIPLSPSESANIVGRQRLNSWAATILSRNSKNSSFAGVWIDQAAGGVIRVGKVSSTAATLHPSVDEARDLVPAALETEFSAKYSFEQLTATQNEITQAVVAHDPILSTFNSVAADVKTNRVVLTLDTDTTPDVRQAVTEKFGPEVDLQFSDSYFTESSGESSAAPNATATISRSAKTGPLYGGAWLSNGGPVAGGNCTVFFSHLFNTLNQWYSVTAGHCGNGTYYEGRNRQGDVLGTGHANGYSVGGSGTCDCVAVGPLTGTHPTNLILVDNNATYRYTSVANGNSFIAGTATCLSGAQSADTNNERLLCGIIASPSRTIQTRNNFTLIDASTVEGIVSQDGDSGGPYTTNHVLMGMHVAYNTGLGQTAMVKDYYIDSRFNASYKL